MLRSGGVVLNAKDRRDPVDLGRDGLGPGRAGSAKPVKDGNCSCTFRARKREPPLDPSVISGRHRVWPVSRKWI